MCISIHNQTFINIDVVRENDNQIEVYIMIQNKNFQTYELVKNFAIVKARSWNIKSFGEINTHRFKSTFHAFIMQSVKVQLYRFKYAKTNSAT